MNLAGDDLRDLKEYLVKGEFDATWNRVKKLNASSLPLGKDLKECSNSEDLEQALNLRSVAAEIADYQGNFALASEFVEKSGEYCLARLSDVIKNPKSGADHLGLLLQDVWVVLQAGLCKYRSASYDDALSMFRTCQNVLSEEPLKKEKHFGARARCLYSIGLVLRERYELKKAIRFFTKSTEFAYQSMLESRKKLGEKERKGEERKIAAKITPDASQRMGPSPLARLAIARVTGMGLAPVHNALGRPDLAIPLILTAKAMLPHGEKIISTHLDLFRATLISNADSTSDTDPASEKSDRISQLKDCHYVFGSLHHRPYQSRTAYYWAKELIFSPQVKERRDQLAKAEELIAEFESAPTGDSRFLLMAFALKSEIARLRENWQLAESLASTGLQLATGKHPAVELDLLMARAQARLKKKDTERAVEDLKSGLNLARKAGNHRLCAIFLLRLSQAYSAKQGADREALRCLSEFKQMEDFLEVKAPDISALEEEAQGLVSKDLIFRYDENYSLEEAEKKVRRFLAKKVRDAVETDAAAAQELKISRQTYYNWVQGKDKKKLTD